MSNTSRLAHLLGEMRREKNGAVADFMSFYGEKYGLNYGVSLATVRAKAAAERSDDSDVDHKFARQLYQQEVRELRLAAFHLADPEVVVANNELDFWAQGIINSEVAEEAAFALLCRCDGVDSWFESDVELLHYAAVMALAKSGVVDVKCYWERLLSLLEREQNLLPKAVVVLLDSAIRDGLPNGDISSFLDMLPQDNGGSNYIREEISWRLEFR